MIHLIATGKSGRLLLFLGLTAENVEKLTAGQPVLVEPEAFGGLIPADVILLYGKTGADVVAQLRRAGLNVPEGAEDTVDNAASFSPGETIVIVDNRSECPEDLDA